MVLCLPPLTSDPVNRLAPNAFQRASEFRALFSSIARPLRPHGFIVAFSSSVRMASTGWIDGRRAPTAPRAAGPSGLGAPVAYPQKNLTPPRRDSLVHALAWPPARPRGGGGQLHTRAGDAALLSSHPTPRPPESLFASSDSFARAAAASGRGGGERGAIGYNPGLSRIRYPLLIWGPPLERAFLRSLAPGGWRGLVL